MSSHHAVVTRLPNHWGAISCAPVFAAPRRKRGVAAPGLARKPGAPYVISPTFSIAKFTVSGIAIWSSFSYGYGMPNQRSSRSKNCGYDRATNRVSARRPRGTTMRVGVGFTPTRPRSTNSHGPTANATRYDGSGRVAAKRTVFIPSDAGLSLSIGVFERATTSLGTRHASCHGTLKPGA